MAAMDDEKPSYLKAAFMNVYNLGLVGGAVAASALTGEYLLGGVALGLEALWLLFAPDMRPFRRAVDRWHREEREKAEIERIRKQMENLPEEEWRRARALDELRREIERDMQQNPSFQALLIQTELDKLSTLHRDFVALATACVRAQNYMSATDARELNKQIDSQKNLEKSLKDEAAQQIARKNVQVLEKRLETIQEIQRFLVRARGQMNLIENSVRLLRDQVLTMASPDQLGEQLDDLITGVAAIQESAREHEAIFSRVGFDPVSPMEDASRAPQSGGRVRS